MKMFYRIPSLVGLVVIFGIVLVNAVVMSAREPLVAEIKAFNTTPHSSVISAETNRPVTGELSYYKKGEEGQEKILQIVFLDDTPEFLLDGLLSGQEYFYKGWLKDAYKNKFEIPLSSLLTMENVDEEVEIAAPSGVKNFEVQGKPQNNGIKVTLSWVSPKEEVLGGFYEIRYASRPLLFGAQNIFNPASPLFPSEEEFSKGIKVEGAPAPVAEEKLQSLTFDIPYKVSDGPFNIWFFAMRVGDEKEGFSPLSPVLWASSLAEAKVKAGDQPPDLVKKISSALLPVATRYLKQAKAFFDVPNNAPWVASTMGPKGEIWLAENKNIALEERPVRPLDLSEQNGFGVVFKLLTGEWAEVYIDMEGKIITVRYDKDKKFIEFLKK